MNVNIIATACMSIVVLTACALSSESRWQSPHFRDGKFVNLEPYQQDFGFSRTLDIVEKFWFTEFPDTEPDHELPVQPLTREQLASQAQDAVYRLGHSTVLMKLNGQYWLTDPIFSERASPVQWMGPKRFHGVPINPATLPEITGVIISHDHYDHLDEDSIELLKDRVQHFFVPLGVAKYLKDWGVPDQKIHELDWWQSVSVEGMRLTATPSNHFSGRGLFNRNETLWASWVIDSGKKKIFFSGDSGYFEGFKEIGKEFGPFDLTIMENGAYNTDWAKSHMFPEETIQAHKDLNGKQMLPVHHGTFKLAFHTWFDPMESISRLGKQHQIPVLTPMMGQEVIIGGSREYAAWWLDAMTKAQDVAQFQSEP